MFDFLKKLFGKKPEPVKQNTEPNLPVHVSNDVKKPAAESLLQKPSVSKYTDQNRPGVALEIQRPRTLTDDYPQNSAPVQTSLPTVQPTRSAVQPVQPVAQPTQPIVKPPVKPTVKYESRPAWTAEQKTTAAKPAVAPVQTKPRPQVVAPRSQPGRVAPSAGKRVQKTSVYIGLDFGTTFTKAAYEIAPCYYIFAPRSWQPASGLGHLVA